MNAPRVGILILSWNAPGQVLACLLSLKKLDYPNCKILVVDNGSSADCREKLGVGLRELKKTWSGLPAENLELLEEERNLGFAGGVNRGLRRLLDQGDCDYFLLLNDDTEPEPGFLAELVAAMERDPSLGIAGPLIRAGSDSPTGWIAQGAISLWTGSTPYSFEQPKSELVKCGMIHGCCFMIRTEVVKRIGLLDESFFAYYEESDFCVRAARAGFGLALVKKARIFHEGGASMRKVSRLKEYLMVRNRLWFVKRNGSLLQLVAAVAWMGAYHLPKRLVRLALDRKWSNIAVLIPAFWHGLFAPSAGRCAELIRKLQVSRVPETTES
ncbi:MAG TPA: glycosyltransferase family 2 protein [Bdellovibrionota bacterium]|nr:glycosyltransferase family 2 protein [Bdellovibrionota bacterium]